MEVPYKKKLVVDYLNEVDYSVDPYYVPSDFAFKFVTFIKMVNGEEGEENKTPITHYRMLDKVVNGHPRIANLCHRGLAKTTLMAEYFILYLAVYGELDNFGRVDIGLYISDSIENGVKNLRKNLEYRYENSEFLKRFLLEAKFTDIRWEFKNREGHTLVFKGYGAQALSLDSLLYTEAGVTTMGACKVGDRIFGPDGKLTTIIKKSEVFYRPMYELKLTDGRTLKVSEDHINSVEINTNPNNTVRWEEKDLTTKELLQLPLIHTKKGNLNHAGVSNKHLVYVKNSVPLAYPQKDLPIDPYTLGCILGDGSVKKNGTGIVITAHADDYSEMRNYLPYELGKPYLDKRTQAVLTWSVKGINQQIRDLGLCVHGNHKFIPKRYFTASVHQRLELLKGLLDTDGSCFGSGRITFCGNSETLVRDTASLVRSLGGKAKVSKVAGRGKFFKVEIWMGVNPFKLSRKAKLFKEGKTNWNRVAIESITPIPMEASQCIAVDNESRQYLSTEYFRTHNTGVRGAKEQGKRPQIALLDDLVSDEDARSATCIAAIENTVYNAIEFALHPTKSMAIWNGTPFNMRDPLYKAVESGAWEVNVFPVCERFPCSREEFRGSWPDRFDYDYVQTTYARLLKAGKIAAFNQELMLRIMSDDDRWILDEDIQWYSREGLLKNKSSFNFYITTDFGTSGKESADFSVISVWAINSKGWCFWVDGVVAKQGMEKNIEDLFVFAQTYKPESVGIEVSGQQGGFIPWIQQKMIEKNIFFNLATENNKNSPGIRPNTDKLKRFEIVAPWFKTKQVFFPVELKTSKEMAEAMEELTSLSRGGVKSKHDDFLDSISMLGMMYLWRPGEAAPMKQRTVGHLWEMEDDGEEYSRLDSYLV